MSLRLVPGSIVVLIALVLGGCSHFDDHWGDQMTVRAGEDVVVAAATGSTRPARAAWAEPTVVPIAFGPAHVVPDGDGPYLLDSGDKLRIFIYGQPNLSRIYTVDHAGRVAVPLIGSVKARGMTTYALERSIAGKLGSQYVRDPQVTVDIVQNRPFFILGEVRNAGQYTYVNGMTAKMAVAVGGGYSERADERKIQITRRNNGLIERMDVPEDYAILPGDTLYVYERFF